MADPTVGDVYDQLVFTNAKLEQIQTNTLPVTAAINKLDLDLKDGFSNTVNSIDKLDTHVVEGFKQTLIGLLTIAKISEETAKLVFHLTQQADTMICALEHISKNTCAILTQVTIQTGLQQGVHDDVTTLRDIAETAHPGAVLDLQRRGALRGQIEKCCPEKIPPDACDYKPCPAPPRAKEPDLPKLPDLPRSGGDNPPPNKEKSALVDEMVGQLEPHLPIDSYEKIQKALPHLKVGGQRVSTQALASHISDGLFPITTAADLELKVDAGLGIARAMLDTLPIDSIQTAQFPAVVAILQKVENPVPRGALGQHADRPIFTSRVKKGGK